MMDKQRLEEIRCYVIPFGVPPKSILVPKGTRTNLLLGGYCLELIAEVDRLNKDIDRTNVLVKELVTGRYN